jgi:ADP-heptose:LPS heptosyltransferase
MVLPRHRLRRWLLRGAACLPLAPTGSDADPPRRVLIVRPDHIGDYVLATPTVQRLRAALPAAHLAVAVGPWAAEAARHGPPVDDLLTIAFPGFSRARPRSPLAPYALLAREAARLRRHAFDTALILRPDHWWGALLVWAAGIPRRLGHAVPEVEHFCTRTPRLTPGTHATAASLALADLLLGAARARTPAAAPLVFLPTPAERERAAALLAPLASGGPLVAIQPGAGMPIKQWPTERWVAVATALGGGPGARLVLTGGPAERALTAPIAAALPTASVLDLTGATDLGTLGAVFARCDLVAGVDSGALHIAAACAPRSLRLFGPSDHQTFGPWADPVRHRLLWAGLACPLCHHLDRTVVCAPDCMGALTPEMVVAACQDLLAVSL